MKQTILLLSLSTIISCSSNDTMDETATFRRWIVDNQYQINLSSDSLIQDYLLSNEVGPGWISSRVAVTEIEPNILGTLVRKAGKTAGCMVVEVMFFKDTLQKKRIMLAAEDSSCLERLKQIFLETDSTDSFIFGKEDDLIH